MTASNEGLYIIIANDARANNNTAEDYKEANVFSLAWLKMDGSCYRFSLLAMLMEITDVHHQPFYY